MKKVTVVVPIYNVEEYLERCLDSLVDQSAEDYEILCVNDGSKDHCQDIIEDYAEEYPDKISYIVKENGGLSDARNAGLERVKTPYVMFIDSDDFVEKGCVKKALERIEEDGSDMAVYAYQQDYVSEGRSEIITSKVKAGVTSLKEDPSILAYTANAAWNKIYKTSLFLDHGIRYPKGLVYEDLATTPRLLSVAEKVSYFDEPLYRYQIGRSGSIMNKVRDDIVEVGELLVSHFRKEGLFEACYNELYYLTWTNITEILRQAMNSKEKEKVNELIDKAFDFKEKNFPKPIQGYTLGQRKSDAVYLKRERCKLYYKVRQIR